MKQETHCQENGIRKITILNILCLGNELENFPTI